MSDKQMQYVHLGTSGLKISKVVLGGMSYGSSKWQEWVLDEEEALPLIEHAYNSGINTWDTSDTYSHGESETIFGKALVKYNIPRHRVVIMTKLHSLVDDEPDRGKYTPLHQCHSNDGHSVNRVGLSRKHIFDAVEDSVRRLGTFIDVLQVHRLDRETPREEIMRALNDVVNSGKVRYIGASSMRAWEFQALQNVATCNGWHRFVSMQSHHSLLSREDEREMIPYCQDQGIGLIPWSPLSRGILTRPWTVASSREIHDVAVHLLVRVRETEADKEIVSRVESLARKKNISMAQLATAWSLSHKYMCPVLGLNSTQRIDEAVAAIRVQLTNEEIEYLEAPYVPKQLSIIEK